MISVIVCSINKAGRIAFAQHLATTIGLPYELILIENDVEELPICAAYNKGAAAAKYPFLCFVHEDVTFHTPAWGLSFVKHLEERTTGFLGLAGAAIKTRNPSPWWITNSNPLADSYRRVHFIQSGSTQSPPAEETNILQEVICLDGFFLMCSKETWSITGFDDTTLTNFHFYDMDICLAAYMKGLKNYVTRDCWIEHHSTGSVNKGWVDSAEQFQKKWETNLPAGISPIPPKDLRQLERLALVDYLHALMNNRYKLLCLKYFLRLLRYGRNQESEQVLKRYLKILWTRS